MHKAEKEEELSRKPSIEEDVDEAAAKMRTLCKSSLGILQWNAEGLSTKVYELTARLKEDDIDICLVQESHLQERSPMPFIDGYKTIRA